MSLIVHAYIRDPKTGEMDFLTDAHAGGEVTRQSYYGSKAAYSLGLTVFPSLREGDIYAEGHELDLLEQEVATLMNNLDFMAKETGRPKEMDSRNLQSISQAINKAKEVQGGVLIW